MVYKDIRVDEALSSALESQRHTREFLGQELIKAGHATAADIEHGLAIQKKLASAWAAMIAAALLAGSVEAHAGNSGRAVGPEVEAKRALLGAGRSENALARQDLAGSDRLGAR